jgi:hypothetical protein
VKRIAAGLFGVVLAGAQAWAQVPRVGVIEYYGFRKVAEEKARQVLNLKPGDPIPPSKGDVEERLEEIPGIVTARLEAVCCEDGKAILFVGVEERGAPHFTFRALPAGSAVLPQDIVDTYQKFMKRSPWRRGAGTRPRTSRAGTR